MPEPSILPIVNAVGVALAIIGITISVAVSIVGIIIFLLSLIAWIRAATHEISELPLDHSSH
jgi:heme/copper-type cytochrome/quinol oxidase subunit 1